jgi:hypothetical protein
MILDLLFAGLVFVLGIGMILLAAGFMGRSEDKALGKRRETHRD